MNKFFKKLINFLGVNSSLVGMLVMVILVGMGEKMAERFLPLYLIAIGGTPIVIGLLNGLDNLLSALYSYPGGWLAEKLGYKKALTIFNLMAIFGYLIVVLFTTWQAVLIGAIFFISWTAISLPATMSLISSVVPANRRSMGVSLNSIVKRIPMALGPIMGGALIMKYGRIQGIRYSFIIAIILAIIALFVQQRFIVEPPLVKKPKQEKSSRHFSNNLTNLLISDILVRFCEQIPYAFVVVWVVENNHLSEMQFGILTAIEMVTAMLIYIPVAYLADRSTRKPYVAITFFNFTIFPLVLLFSKTFPTLIFAFIIRGLKEFGEPTRKALIMDLAPEDSKAWTFGTYYFIRDVIVSVAAFAGAFLWKVSPALNFLVAAGFGILGTLYFILKVHSTPVAQTAVNKE
ncbi:MAG: MFS transporter [Candidatus Cloacimonadaceae bacterium]|mgnify:FL=1|jgi:MFS family permease|nr:MFS transporter [Candidatus Cloacimonadota bacterium]MDD5625274.1 MFS transporter [Candidatus Cloacimonadota bacterium]MDY0111960.1 MFS transporter [Candidatus Syntrophosphaera sp.]